MTAPLEPAPQAQVVVDLPVARRLVLLVDRSSPVEVRVQVGRAA